MENESIAEQAETIKKQKSGALIAVCTGLGIVAVISLAFNAYQFIYRADGEDKDVLIAKYAEKTGVSADELREAIKNETADALFEKTDEPEEEKEPEEDKKEESSAESEKCDKAELSGNYIYFPEYGLKLKKSKKLDHYAWRIDNNNGETRIYISAQPKGLDELREYANLDTFSFGFGAATIRNGNEADETESSIAFKDGEVIVSYSGAQAYYDVEGTEDEQKTVREEIVKMLANGFSRI